MRTFTVTDFDILENEIIAQVTNGIATIQYSVNTGDLMEWIGNVPAIPTRIVKYLTRDELSTNLVRLEFLEQRLKDIFAEMETAQRAEAYASLLEYGMVKKVVGEQTAAELFKKIITSTRD